MNTRVFSQAEIAKALMANYQSDVVSNVDRERNPDSEQQLQLFNINNITRNIVLNIVHLPKDKELRIYKLAVLRIHRPQSNVPTYRNRDFWIQVALDERESLNADGRKIINNSNPYYLDLFLSNNKEVNGTKYSNPFNSLIVDGYLRTAPVPLEKTDAQVIHRYNKCSEKVITIHNAIKQKEEESGIPVYSNPAYRTSIENAYQEYLQAMEDLINEGLVTITEVLNVADSKLVPALTLDSTMKSANPYLCSVGGHLDHVSYTPVVNKFFGYVAIDSNATKDEASSVVQLGLRSLSNSTKDSELDESTTGGRQEATKLGYISDTYGNETSILLRRQDNGYVSPKNPNSKGLAQIFDEVTQNNEHVFVRGEYLPISIGQNSKATRGTVIVNSFTKVNSNSIISSTTGIDSDTLVFDTVLDEGEESQSVSNELTFTSDEGNTQEQTVEELSKTKSEVKQSASKKDIL